jgi:hypothetical protein
MKAICTLGFLLVSAGIVLAQEQPISSTEPDSLDEVFGTDAAVAPLSSSTASTSYQYTVAHFPFGGGWNTQIMLGNGSGKTASVKITFMNQAGASAAVPLAGKGLQSTQSFSAAANRTLVISGDTTKRDSASLEEFWATVTSNEPLDTFILSDLASKPPAISGAVGAVSLAPSKTFRFPVAVNGPNSFDAQLAIANPNNSAATVTVKVLSSTGSVSNTFEETLAANNQMLFNLTDKVKFSSSLFNGAVAVCATEPVGLVVIGVEGVGQQAMYNTAVTTDPCP